MEQRTIQVNDRWYVLATLAQPEDQPQALKSGETFALFDRFGDVAALVAGSEGVYHQDTRHLSRLELLVAGTRPLHLGSSMEEAQGALGIDLMNPDITGEGELLLPKGTLHLHRSKLLRDGICHERITVTNHGTQEAAVRVALTFGADFVDLFEVRGMRRSRRGERLPPQLGPHSILLSYRGLDGHVRRTELRFEPRPLVLDAGSAAFDLRLRPGEHQEIFCTVVCDPDRDEHPPALAYAAALDALKLEARQAADRCRIECSNPQANLWFERSFADLAMLTTQLPSGPYPYAGVPWYSTTFGRDGILTAIEYLWVDPALARGVLRFLADTQARESDTARDAEPGKILHEARSCEMAATGEIPFGQYYGTVDATPLFVLLAGLYWRRTGDTGFLRSIWPQLMAALQWIDRYGDMDADGFVEYARRSRDGLVQQGWKDSSDSVFHQDGRLADAPIALCEVQGYVYAAKSTLAEVAENLGERPLARRLVIEAVRLRERFLSAFWCPDRGTYALALDGHKRPCTVLASNVGHCLWSGIAAPEHASRIVDLLTGQDFFSGWGLRTIAQGEPRYNPMSYHNGSIWPHDNALAALGMARYGRTDAAVRVMTALFEASLHFDMHRMPELFCGVARRAGAGPTRYPVACAPQAWAAAAPFALLQACLGLEIRAGAHEVLLHSPRLPPFTDWVRIERLGAPGPSCDLLLQRHERSVGVEVLRRDPEVRIAVVA
jgi:glycogen debranching enzyme